MSERFFYQSEVAEFLGVSVETVRRLITEQGLPATKYGDDWRCNIVEFEEWLKARERWEKAENS